MAPAPDYYSQRNCALLGLGHRAFLELLRRKGAPVATKVGKLRLVEREELLGYLRRLRDLEAAKPAAEVDGADHVLLEIGCAPRPRRRRAG